MDQYDNHMYDHGGKYDDSSHHDNDDDDDDQLSTAARCSKNCLFFVNFLMLLVGVAIIALSIFVKENEEDLFGFGSVDLSVIYLAIACGVLIIIISFFGCVGVN